MEGIVIENVKIALRAIKVQRLRTVLTVLIIAIGITSLVGILTAITAIETKLTDDFTRLGANTFTISNFSRSFGRGNKTKPKPQITYQQATTFAEEFNFPAKVAITSNVSFSTTVKYKDFKTNPNVSVLACNESYLATSGYELEEGRNFTSSDISINRNVVIIGKDIATKLFGTTSAINENVRIGNTRYEIIAVLKSKGSSMGFSGDNQCLVPLRMAQVLVTRPNYSISVQCLNAEQIDLGISEATGLFRIIRRDPFKQESSFEVSNSTSLAEFVVEQTSKVTVIAAVIGVITLLGAAIGLMNIMLVSVTERTKEIGTRKALGASAKLIRNQFLIESIVIGQLGGIVGIGLGIIIGNVVSLIIGGSFIIPWLWIFMGVALCFVVGVGSGYMPARNASRLDPIDALRHD